MITGNKELMRDINERLILQTIIREGQISRANLAQKIGLTKATVSAIVSDLIEKQLVMEIGSDQTAMGRKPILLTFAADCGSIISIDLNNQGISALTCNLKGDHCQVTTYPHTLDRDTILFQLETIITNCLELLPPTYYGVVGISIGIHGTVYENNVSFIPYAPYKDVPFQSHLEDKFQIPVYLENEANLSVIGEHTFRYHDPNLIGVSVHTGFGVGIIIDHKLYRGFNGNAGEFGHTIVERGGRPCPCGNRGCLEQYASERILLQAYFEQKQLPMGTMEDFLEAYHKKEELTHTLVTEFISYMALALNNLATSFNPNTIVLNSSLIMAIPDLLTKIQQEFTGRISQQCTLKTSSLQDMSILLGGACISIQNFLRIEHLTFENL